jgi:hypothetical protein
MSNRTYSQYRNKPKTTAWLNIVPTIADKFYQVYNDIAESWDIDTASSYELDVIGRIVGIDRSFEALTVASGFDNDEVYRMLIRAKIARNTTDCTSDGIIKAVRFIVGIEEFRIVNNEDFTFSVEFEDSLTPIQRYVLATFEVVPTAQAVNFLGYVENAITNRFGDGKTFGGGQTFSSYYGPLL